MQTHNQPSPPHPKHKEIHINEPLPNPQNSPPKHLLITPTPSPTFTILSTHQLEVDFTIHNKKQRNKVNFQVLMNKNKDMVKLRLLAQGDLFFHYHCMVGYSDLKGVNQRNCMSLDSLDGFLVMIQRELGEAETQDKVISFEISGEGVITMLITKFTNHKAFTVLTLDFEQPPHRETVQLAAYRYGGMRQEVAELQQRISNAKEMVRCKNPYLLTFINKL